MTLACLIDDAPAARSPSALAETVERLGLRTAYARDARIYAQDDPVSKIYRVVRGVVRTIRIAPDGRRQVGGFYESGDIFGLEPGPDHQFSAEALTDCTVQAVRRDAVRAFAGDAELDRAILEATRRELQRAQAHVMLLGRRNAREKVAAFLMSLAGRGEASVELSMGRQDMADYLGLTIETVSRTLTQLQGEAIVEFPSSRRFRVKRWDALEGLAA